MFRFFRSTPKPAPAETPPSSSAQRIDQPASGAEPSAPVTPSAEAPTAPRQSWLSKLKAGLRKTGGSIAAVFTGTQIDDELYDELETALSAQIAAGAKDRSTAIFRLAKDKPAIYNTARAAGKI